MTETMLYVCLLCIAGAFMYSCKIMMSFISRLFIGWQLSKGITWVAVGSRVVECRKLLVAFINFIS